MTTKTRLTIENGEDNKILSRLEYTLSNGERVIMEMHLPVTGSHSRTIQEVEAQILQRTKDLCTDMLGNIGTRS